PGLDPGSTLPTGGSGPSHPHRRGNGDRRPPPTGVALVSPSSAVALVVLAILVLFVVIALARTIRIVPQQTAIIVERLGSYDPTLPGRLPLTITLLATPRAIA